MVHPGTTRSLMLGLILAAFFVAGCGGGGDDVSRGTHDMLQEELDDALAMLMATETERDTARAEVTRLTGELATATTSVTSLTTQLDTASGSVTSLMSELSDAEAEVMRLTNEIGSSTDPTSLQGMLAAANADVSRLNTELATANALVETLRGDLSDARDETARLRGQLTDAQDDIEEERDRADDAVADANRQRQQLESQLTEAQQANLRARADGFITVLGKDDAPASESATVSWMRGGSLQFMPNASYLRGSAAPSVPGGWRSASFTGRAGTAGDLVNDTVYLYTNIQSPSGRAFWKVHGDNVTINTQLESLSRGSSAQPGPDTDTMMPGRQFSEIRISGSLNGTGGTFTCTVGNCVCAQEDCGMSAAIQTEIENLVTFSQGQPDFTTEGSWIFEPGSLTASSYQLPQDDAYLYFGIWVSEPDVITGTPNFQYIAGGGGVDVDTNGLVTVTNATPTEFDTLTGTASFQGGAVGSYVTRDQVGQQNSRIGSFTATASFNVDFGADDAAGTLHGQITDFREGGTSLAGWSLTLGDTDNVAMHETIGTTGLAVGRIGTEAASGSWSATFYGSNNPGVEDFGGANEPACPVSSGCPAVDVAGLAGWFAARTGTSVDTADAAIAGAFAATP